MSHTVVMLEKLRKDEKIFTVERLISQRELNQRICLKLKQGHYASIDANMLYTVLKDEFS